MVHKRAAVSAIGLAAVSMFWSAGALALGLGDVEVRSRLNERFSAAIPLISASPEDLDSVVVEIASPDEFARRGIERSDLVNGLRFERNGNGIRVASPQPVRDPFLNFIVEVRWNGGRLLREYTVLLDPPATAPTPPPAPTVLATPTPLPLPAAAAASDTPSRYGPVQPAQTLWSIAKTLNRDPAVSMDQMLLALYNANPKAFIGGNINHLLVGRTLVVPSTAEALVVNAEAARVRVMELRAAVSPAAPETTVAAAVPPPATTPVAQLPPAPAPLPEPAPAPTAELPPPAVTPPATSEPAAVTPVIESGEAALAPEAAPSTELPPPAEVVPPPVEAIEPPVPAPTPVVEPADEPTSAPPVAEEPLPWGLIGGLLLLIVGLIAVKLKRRKEPEVPPKRGSFSERLPAGPDPLLDPPRSRPMPVDEPADDAPTVVTKPVMRAPEPPPVDDDEDATLMAPIAPLAGVGAGAAVGAATLGLSVDAGDPLTEADFHLAYGLYDEAAQMLKNAIAADPDRVDLKLKLAETWSAAGNARDFQALAESMAGKVTASDWQKISTMGRALLPDLALFGASAPPPGGVPAAAASLDPLRDLSVIDFDLDAGSSRLDAPLSPATPPSAAPTLVSMPEPISEPIHDPITEGLLQPLDEPMLEFVAPPSVAPAAAPIPAPPPPPPIALTLPEPIPMPEPAPAAAAEPTPVKSKVDLLADIDLSSFDLDDESAGASVDPGLVEFTMSDLEAAVTEPLDERDIESEVIGGDEIDTKLDLARAYADMGDLDAARSLLAEVAAAGNDKQQQEARALSQRLSG